MSNREKFTGRKLLSAIGVIFASDGASQFLRFFSNLALTWLLVPKCFGTIILVNLVRQALEMFADVGIGTHVVRSADGEKKEYLDTAWTVQLVRSFLLWGLAVVSAWPMTLRYPEHEGLGGLICAAGALAVIDALASMSVHTVYRRLEMGRLSLLNIVSQVIGAAVSIVLACFWRSPWVLAGGMFASAASRSVLSYFMLTPYRPVLRWAPVYVHDLWSFGKWIFVASALTFISGKGELFFVGSILTPEEFGKYGITFMLVQTVPMIFQSATGRVLYPFYCTEFGTDSARRRITRLRVILMLSLGVVLAGMGVFGSDLIRLLYKEDYWMPLSVVPLICLGFFFNMMNMTFSSLPLAAGESRRYTLIQFLQVVALIVTLGALALSKKIWLADVSLLDAFLIAVFIVSFIKYVMLLFCIRHYRLYSFKADAMICAGVLLAVGLFWLIHDPVMDVVNAVWEPLRESVMNLKATLKGVK